MSPTVLHVSFYVNSYNQIFNIRLPFWDETPGTKSFQRQSLVRRGILLTETRPKTIKRVFFALSSDQLATTDILK